MVIQNNCNEIEQILTIFEKFCLVLSSAAHAYRVINVTSRDLPDICVPSGSISYPSPSPLSKADKTSSLVLVASAVRISAKFTMMLPDSTLVIQTSVQSAKGSQRADSNCYKNEKMNISSFDYISVF